MGERGGVAGALRALVGILSRRIYASSAENNRRKALMTLEILQVGWPVLRQRARALGVDEIRSAETQRLIEQMRETMREAPGVGLAAPQIGYPLQLAVIEDREDYLRGIDPAVLQDRERAPVPFHVIVNPRLTVVQDLPAVYFEGCLSLDGFAAMVPRAIAVRVDCLNEHGEARVIEARGWYARILQHEIDHLRGVLYIDRMLSRSFMSIENLTKHWADKSMSELHAGLGLPDREAAHP
jgi:peptide deformylase